MPQLTILWAASNLVSAVSCCWLLVLLLRLGRLQSGAMPYHFALTATGLWIAGMLVTHATVVAAVWVKIPLVVMGAQCLAAASSIVCAACLRVAVTEYLRLPKLKDTKAACDALARTVAHLSERVSS